MRYLTHRPTSKAMRSLVFLALSHAAALHITPPLTSPSATITRCHSPLLAASTVADDAAVTSAATALLAEVAKSERSLAAIARHVATLEAAPPPSKAGALKKALQGDWKLTFASDEAAVAPFTSGAASGPFTVLEEVYHRLLTGDMVQSIEIVRRIGPFGNSARALCGR